MIRFILSALAALLFVAPAAAVDLESFDFNDANSTPLTAAANTANPGNSWFYDEEATVPGDETTGDTSTIQSGAYRIITDSTFAAGLDSRYLDIANTSSGTVYLAATFSNWDFGAYDGSTEEQVRFTFLDDDTGTSGSSVTAQVQVRRNPDTGSMELFGDAIGTAGSFDIANTVDLPDSKSSPFTMVLAVDKDSNSFEVFYKDGSAPSQALGLGGVSRARDVNSVRMVTNNFGAENFLPFVITEEARLDRFVVSDTNPLTDLITLEIDRTTGQATLINNSGAAVTGVTSITLESATSSIDTAELAGFSGTLGSGQTVPLDGMPGTAAGPWRLNPIEDVRAELVLSGGGVRTLDVNFVANSGLKWVSGDLDFDGVIDADDYTILSANSETDLSGFGAAAAYQRGDLNGDGFNDVIDFGAFKDTFIAANGAPAFARLIAGVPEPGSACLVLLAGLGLAVRRRRPASVSPQENNRTMIQTAPKRIGLFVLFALIATAHPAQAVIFEEFLFNDPAGTLYTAAANNANPGNLWDEDVDTIDVTTNGLGQLDASQKANTGFGTNYIDIDPGITTGLIYGVLELTWDFQSALDTAENEEIRLSFINADPRSTAITAQYQITRTDADILELNGSAIGTGASNITATTLNGGSLTQTDKFIAVLAADLDNDSYEVLYSNNAGSSFSLLGSGAMDPTRGIEAIRLTLNNDLSDDNVLIDRFYLADELPIVVEPDLLTLRVHPKSGFVALANATEAEFDIDYYRIKSEDDSLLTEGWNSLQSRGLDAIDGPDAGSVAGDSAGETWTEAGGSDAGVLSESFLLSSTQIGPGDSISLGRAVDLAGNESLLEFEYREATNGNVFTGLVEIAEGLPGDFNLDGSVDAADYTVFRDNASGLFVPADYAVWSANYGATAGSSSSTAIPEPTALALIVALAGWSFRQR